MWKKFLHSEVYQASLQEQNVTAQFGGTYADGDGEIDPNEAGLWQCDLQGWGEKQTPS